MARKPKPRKKRVWKPGPNTKKVTAFRMPDELMADLGEIAKRMNLSRNKLCELALRRFTADYLKKDNGDIGHVLDTLAAPVEAADATLSLFS